MAVNKGRGPDRVQRFIPALLVLASLLSLIVSTRSLMGVPERIGLSVFGFFQRGMAAVGTFIGDTATSISELRQLRSDYDALLEKTRNLDRMEREYADVRLENERLLAQLGFSTRVNLPKVAARIIAKDPGNLYATITIDKGIGDGLRKNMPVIAWQDGVQGLVGRVIEASQSVSQIVPVYDNSSYVASRFAKSRFEGLVIGQGSDVAPLLVKYVRKRAKDELQPGDLIVTSGLESLYPAELALARVTRIRELAYQTSLEIDAEPVLDFTRLEYVFVLIQAEANGPVLGTEGGKE
ncbi:MAG: rod shape-determining protein MreC [Rectinemataceae bacterium]